MTQTVRATVPLAVPTVDDHVSYAAARELYSNVRRAYDAAKEEKDRTFTGPLKAVVKALDDAFKKQTASVVAFIDGTKTALEAYQQKQLDAQQARAAKAAARLASRGKDEQAVAVVEAAKTVDSAGVTHRQVVEITDPLIIDRAYLVPDLDKIKKALDAGVEVKGARLKTVVSVRIQ